MVDTSIGLTHIHLVDEHRIYLAEISERFQNPLKYNLESYSDIATLLDNLETSTTGKKNLHLVFMSVDFEKSEEEVNKMMNAIIRIKELRKNCEVFVLSSQKDENLENRVQNIGTRALIQKNENAVLRITNYIKGIISEKNLERKRKATIFSIKILFYFILAVAAITLILFLIYPDRFYF